MWCLREYLDLGRNVLSFEETLQFLWVNSRSSRILFSFSVVDVE